HVSARSMHRTLFIIPHELGPFPIFGVGWALIILVAALGCRLAWAHRQFARFGGAGDGRRSENGPPTVAEVLSGEGIFWVIAAVLITLVLPRVELENAYGEPVGMAIRGYGVFLVCGVLSAVALAAWRTYRAGMDPELIFSLTPWVFGFGLFGARLFYVIQYRDDYIGETLGETIKNMMAFTEGGLVVYGSFIGGFIGYLIFTRRNKIPMLRFADAIVPCIFLGVFFGRIGCLLNGCCYGGRCEEGWAALRFPPITKIYQEQLSSGELLGMKFDPETRKISSVTPGSIAAGLGIKENDVYEADDFDRRPFKTADPGIPEEEVVPGWIMRISGKTYVLSPQELPDRALPVRAAQPISSISSLILCVVLCTLSLYVRRTGALMFIGFASYAVLRFVLEIVRVDELGQFNTSLTISQWVSVVVFVLSIAGLVWLYFIAAENDEDTTAASSEGSG
ncbi:MAG: prolipoprotein diacylglyceryl transferase, partial [Planctomycetales bacterium]|nr:prolipoprotein diacylglyceryl transferase [Planctomycetales bacterium]